MNKKLNDKIKSGISPQEMETFVRNHTPEVFSTLAIFVAGISSMFDFFSGPAWSILFVAIGAIFSLSFPQKVDRKLKEFYHFSIKQEKTTEMVLGGVKLVVAIFLPFIYFCFLGLLAGVSYHFYIRHAQITEPSDKQTAETQRKKR
jgi:Fe2+ transport system protein B